MTISGRANMVQRAALRVLEIRLENVLKRHHYKMTLSKLTSRQLELLNY